MDSNGQNIGLHYEGVLEKAGKRFFEGFRKRWFILEGKDLFYYKAQETNEQNLLGIIDMTKMKSVIPFKMINNSFQIISSTRTYTFTAPSPQSMTEWISVLRQAMQLESFSNRRAKHSFRESTQDDGYEVVSRPSRSSSKLSAASQQSFTEDDDTFDDNDLYSQIDSSSRQDKAENKREDQIGGTYESVGSFKQNHKNNDSQNYDVVGRQGSLQHKKEALGTYDTVVQPMNKTKSKESHDFEFGSYSLIGESDNKPPGKKPQDEDSLYSQVQKPKKCPLVESSGSLYVVPSSVGVSNNIGSDRASNQMPVLVESDTDDEEVEEEDEEEGEEEDEDSSSPSQRNIDPLPPPVGDVYAADKIKNLLLEIGGDADMKSEKQNSQKIFNEDNSAIPESCEKAFCELKQFLAYLEKTEG